MSEPRSFLDALLGAVIEAVEPVEQALGDPVLFAALMEDLGWVIDPGPTDASVLEAKVPVGELLETARAGVESIRSGEATPELYSALFDSTLAVIDLLRALDAGAPPPTLPAPLSEADFWGSLATDLVGYLIVRRLREAKPVAYALLHLFGIIDRSVPPANERRLEGHLGVELRWDRLGTLASDPASLAVDVYGWGATFDHVKLLDRLQDSLTALGLSASQPEPDAGTIETYFGSPTAADAPRRELRLLLATGATTDGAYAEVGLSALAIPAQTGGAPIGLLVSLYAEGSAELAIALSDSVTGRLVGVVDADRLIGVELRPGAARLADTAAVDVRAGVELDYAPPEPALLFGGREGTRAEIAGAALGFTAEAGTGGLDVGLRADVSGFALVVSLADADAFLGGLLGDGELALRADLGIVWSQRAGLRVDGAAELRFELPLMLTLGPIELQRLLVSVGVDGTDLEIGAAITARGMLGPLVLVVEEVGAALRFTPDPQGAAGGLAPALAFKPPKGVGISIDAGPVSGGGYLFVDADAGQYAGILQLKLPILSLTAIGLVTTRLPDGREGFSLLVIITAEFAPIQLGYGFTLNGVGGLLGIHRTMIVDAIRDGVRTRTLDSIMFPPDPIANAPRIISDLQRVFPPAEGRFTFGPMVALGWGPNALLELQLALILELPSPIRLAILGRVRVALPTKDEAVVDLRMDVAGILDFGRCEASVDASLVDSRITVFALTGDIAMRLGWGATKAFALSAGGFNRRFQPPAGFPPLGRLALSLATGDNPVLRLEAYFAVTSNTLQFGARVEVSARVDTVVGRFSAVGSVSFDTLIEFDPFRFVAELVGLISVAHNDRPLLEARLEASLTGPNPWHAAGFVELDFLGKHRIAVEATTGEEAPEAVPLVDLHAILVEELSRPSAWVALPPTGAAAVVAVRDAVATEGVVVHPLGSVALHQRAMPFAKMLNRYGAGRPEIPTRFEVRDIRVGAAGGTPETVLDDFAPAQYDELTDDEKLARPAFEQMQAGGRAAAPGISLPAPAAPGSPAGVHVELGYEEAVVDAPTAPPRRLRRRAPRPLPPALATAVAGAGGEAVGLTTPGDLAVGLGGERFVVARLETLMAGEEATLHATSAAEAYDALAALGDDALHFAVVGAHEALS